MTEGVKENIISKNASEKEAKVFIKLDKIFVNQNVSRVADLILSYLVNCFWEQSKQNPVIFIKFIEAFRDAMQRCADIHLSGKVTKQ